MNDNELPAYPQLFCDESLLLSLIPPFGPRAALMASRGVLKVAAGREIAIQHSELTFFDAAGRPLAAHAGAFGLASGTLITGPVCRNLKDQGRRPDGAASMQWRLDGHAVAVEILDPPESWGSLRAYFLPLQVPVSDDFHCGVHYVNTGTAPVSSVEGVRQAVCHVDGEPYRSAAGGTWNGPSMVPPGRAFGARFSLSDFPGAPRQGVHEISLEMFGLRTSPATVRWSGET